MRFNQDAFDGVYAISTLFALAQAAERYRRFLSQPGRWLYTRGRTVRAVIQSMLAMS